MDKIYRTYAPTDQTSRVAGGKLAGKTVQITRGDTAPRMLLLVKDGQTGQPVSLKDATVKVYLGFQATLGADIGVDGTSFRVREADALRQVKVGDVVEVSGADQSLRELAIVSSLDVAAKTVGVTRNPSDPPSTARTHKKGDSLTFYRIFSEAGYIDSIADDDPLTEADEQDYSEICYDWTATDTTHSGTYRATFVVTTSDGKVRTFPEAGSGDYVVRII